MHIHHTFHVLLGEKNVLANGSSANLFRYRMCRPIHDNDQNITFMYPTVTVNTTIVNLCVAIGALVHSFKQHIKDFVS